MSSKQKDQHSPVKKKFTSPLGNQKYVKGISPRFKTALRDFSKSAKHAKQKGQFELVQRKKLQEKQKASPIRYQLGGDCTDPLNLNSLIDRDPSFVTPQASPSPRPSHEESPIPILEPRDSTDPLNLKFIPSADGKEGALITPKKKKRKKKRPNHHDVENDGSLGKDDKDSPKEKKHRKRKKLKDDSEEKKVKSESEGEDFENDSTKSKLDKDESESKTPESPTKKSRKCDVEDPGTTCDVEISNKECEAESVSSCVEKKVSESHVESKRQSSETSQKAKKKNKLFIYGNYNRYYGYRNNHGTEDSRVKRLKNEWFQDKAVLDIGCNVGHLTLTIARDFAPCLVMGIDIDTSLINAARNNLRYYTGTLAAGVSSQGTEFPVSFSLTKGPLSAPIMGPRMSGKGAKFPHNVFFKQENYVPADERVLEKQQPMYDTILCLSVTKWIHLNWGDRGLKMMFQKMFRSLQPGGRLILEPQPFASYKKRKNLTEKIRANYDAIRFRPEHFIDYLLSTEVGFVTYEALETPFHKAAGFQRPLYLFTKAPEP